MRARYPDQVGGDNPVSPVELFGYPSPFGTVCVARTLAGVLRTRGHPGLDSQGEYDCRSYDGRVTGQAGFVGTSLVHPNGSTRP
jgi:hypothetical protein